MDTVKIASLELENVKRIRAVAIEPTENGLTIIGGNNNQGKTSVLDSIAWALGGDKYRPSQPQREDSTIPPALHIVLSNGLVVERRGKNSDLKVIDPSGNKGGQQLINEFISQLALDLPKFLGSTSKEKAQTLLQIIGVGDQLFNLEYKEKSLYDKRRTIGQIAEQKRSHADELTSYPDAPDEIVSASELIRQQQDILARNGENQMKRQRVNELLVSQDNLKRQIDELVERLDRLTAEHKQVTSDLMTAEKTAEQLHDESTVEIEKSLADIDAINVKVRANLEKARAEDDAKEYDRQYATLTEEIESVRKQKLELLNNAELPLPGLSVEDGELTYNGFKWDNMSGSDQLKVSTAIVRKLNPNCGFVLLDKLEQMDLNTLREFGVWLQAEGLQAIATRVSTGDECSVIIEDGYAVKTTPDAASAPTTSWKNGEF